MCIHTAGDPSRCKRPHTRGFTLMRLASAGLAIVLAASETNAGQQLVAGANVNMGGGPACTQATDANCPRPIYGDVSLQRQNEGSMACSSRNPATCLAAGNDYRLVNLPGIDDGKVTADSWLGIYWTRNGGATWRSTMLAGWKTADPQFSDTSQEALASPVRAFDATADPTVRAGTHGLFYVSGVAFNRAGENASAPLSGIDGKKGMQFVAVFIDDNNTSDPDAQPRYLWTVAPEAGTSGKFLDKPWIAVDIPRGGAPPVCTIPAGPGGVPAAQTIQAGTAYVAYAVFLGEGNNPHSEIWVKKSTDCGRTWGSAAKVTASVPLSQSPMLVINPTNGNLHVVWREFGVGGGEDRILTAKSTNFAKSFSKPVEIHRLGVPAPLSTAYDQATLPSAAEPGLRMARSNDYPAACIGTDGLMRVLFSKRIQDQRSRIVVTTSADGVTWSPPAAVDNHSAAGHQFQPSIACAGPRSVAFWLDQRNDNAFWLLTAFPDLPHVIGPFIIDVTNAPPTHTVDSRAAHEAGLDAAGNPIFAPSLQVSRYQVRYDTGAGTFVQQQFNPMNLPLFASGLVPFHGDYPEIVVRNPFKPPVGALGWRFNDFADESPVLHAVWTDNRDVLRDPLAGNTVITGGTFTAYGAPDTSACTPGTPTWTRNQNLYTAMLSSGLAMQAEGNARRSPDALRRGYVVRLQNLAPPDPGSDGVIGTDDDVVEKRFRLTIGGTGGESFDWRNDPVMTIEVTVPAFSGAARTVFVPRNSTAAFEVKAVELGASGPLEDGLKGSVIIAPDPTAPEDPATASGERHDLLLDPVSTPYGISYTYANPAFLVQQNYSDSMFLTNILNPSYITPSYITPSYITPSYITPSYVTPSYITPSYVTPSYITPSYVTPSYITPSYITPSYITPSYITLPLVTDTNYVVTNTGNVTSGYDLTAMIQSLAANAVFQLQVNRLYAEPSPESICAGEDCEPQALQQTCGLGRQVGLQPLANVTAASALGLASFSLAPGEFAIVTLRVACASGTCFDPLQNLTIIVRAQAPNCDDAECSIVPETVVIDSAAPLLTLPAPVTAPATSGSGAAVTFTVSATDALDGPVTPNCTPASGAVFPVGATTVTCMATDTHGNTATGTFTVTVTNAAPTAHSQTVNALEDTPVNITLVAGDVESDPLTFTLVSLPQHGVLTQGGAPMSSVPALLSGATLTYVPSADYNGPDSFRFKATDAPYLHDSNEAVVSIAVSGVNDAPVIPAEFDGGTIESGATERWSVSAIATDIDSSPIISSVSVAPQHGTVAIGGAGTFVEYTSTAPFVGDDRFTVTITDGGFTASSTVRVAITYGTQFHFNGLLSPYAPPPRASNAGSSVPIVWQYADSSMQPVNSAYAYAASLVTVTFTQLTWGAATPPPNCEGGTETSLVQVSWDYPGNSSFQYFPAENPHPVYGAGTWQFNWQTGPPVSAGCWRVRVILDINDNNQNKAVPDAADLVRAFLLKLK